MQLKIFKHAPSQHLDTIHDFLINNEMIALARNQTFRVMSFTMRRFTIETDQTVCILYTMDLETDIIANM